MPNWCYNSVTFSGPEEKLEELSNMIEILKKKAELEGRGVLPDFIEDDAELMTEDDILYLFDIDYSRDSPEYLIFSSRWSPALETIHRIGIKLGLSFRHHYDESSNMIYGLAIYNDETGDYSDIYLEEAEYDVIEERYDEENNMDWYYFEGIEYEVHEEILEILLKRKIQRLNINN